MLSVKQYIQIGQIVEYPSQIAVYLERFDFKVQVLIYLWTQNNLPWGNEKAPTAGLGPTTSGLATRCSATELRGGVGRERHLSAVPVECNGLA